MKKIALLILGLVLVINTIACTGQPEVTEVEALGNHESLVLPETVTSVPTSSVLQTPDIIEGIEVYGLKENIDSAATFNGLKNHFNQVFDAKVYQMSGGVLPADDYLKRDLVWGRNVRVLEVIVRKSDFYNDPVGGSLVQRMKVEVDLMNRLLERTDPVSGLSARLVRVVVVDDKFAATPSWYPLVRDVDHSEFIGGDEAGSKFSPMWPGEFVNTWEINADAMGNVSISWKGGEGRFEGTYTLPAKYDSVVNLTDYQVSYYRIHELFHRLFNFPDEYIMQIRVNENKQFMFSDYIPEGGQFAAPEIQPFIAYLSVLLRDQGVRGTYHPLGGATDQNTTNQFSIRPDTIRISVPGASELKIFTVDMNGGYYAQTNESKKPKFLNSTPGQVVIGSVLTMDPSLFTPSKRIEKSAYNNIINNIQEQEITVAKTVYLVQAKFGEVTVDLSMPVTPFVMSKLSGQNDVTYEIVFADARVIGKSLYSKAIKDSEVQTYFAADNKVVYATMKIPGTAYTMVWFQKIQKSNFSSVNVIRPTPAPVTVVP